MCFAEKTHASALSFSEKGAIVGVEGPPLVATHGMRMGAARSPEDIAGIVNV